MKKLLLTTTACLAVLGAVEAKDPVDWVNTQIGSISHMLVPCFPTLQLPNGMLRLIPPNHDFTQDRVSGFVLQNPGHRNGGVFTLRPGPGPMTYDQQHVKPYRSDVYVDSAEATVSIAPTRHAAIMEIGFEGAGEQTLTLGTCDRGRVAVKGTTVTAVDHFKGVPVYLYGEFDAAPEGVEATDNGARAKLRFGNGPRKVNYRYAISYISAEQAEQNLKKEINHWNLHTVASAGRDVWNRTLGQIEVEGAADDRMAVFYTSLWRCYERMVNVTEDGRYLGYDRKPHAIKNGLDHYTDDWIWDTYRAHHPLMVLLRPEEEAAKLQSYIHMAEQNREGWMPLFPGIAHDHHCMNGFHVPASFLDAWRKGVRGFDLARAYELSAKTLREESKIPWHRGPKVAGYDDFYDEHGWVPALKPGEREPLREIGFENRQTVAVTQAFSYDAWCMSEIAKELNRPAEEIEKFAKESLNYRKLFRKDTGFFHPKDKDGKWIEPFDYRFSGGIGARAYYDENNAWTYIWDVQHDLPGLVELFGGAKPFSAQMERMFNEGLGCARYEWPSRLPDSTGMFGQFVMGNEPSFHVPYLFNFAGEPWKTQKLVRKLLEAWFRNDLMGIPGDEDGGGMTAFVVFSSLGFYPVTPGRPEYAWGSPIFTKATIHLSNGKDFVLEAPNASADAKYIQRVLVNGKEAKGTWLKHADIVNGGRVTVEMDRRPNKNWK